jgi:PIN domain nuclease of toxin-antitoxin system
MGSGRLPGKNVSLRAIANQLAQQRFILLPIRVEDLVHLGGLPRLHGDPFDRLLIAQALEEGVPLLTADATIARYSVETVW